MATLGFPAIRPVESMRGGEGERAETLGWGEHGGRCRGVRGRAGVPDPRRQAPRRSSFEPTATPGRGMGEAFSSFYGQGERVAQTRHFHAMAAQMQKREAHLQAALHRERAITSTLQAAFLPQCLPQCPGYAFAASYHPALQEAEVGGDFYDLFRLPGEQIGVLLGDVAGKGLAAATYATMARYTVRAYALQSASPAEVLARVNAALCETIDDPAVFVTACYAVLDPAADLLRYAAAGHWPALVARRQSTLVVGSRSLALGIAPNATYEEDRLALEPGDSLLLYTDGLVEIGTEDPMDHLEAVRRLLERRRGQTPQQIVQRLYRDALRRAGGALRDDVALLAVRRDPRLRRSSPRGGDA